MTEQETIKWLQNLKKDIGKIEHQDLWHYEQALDETIEALKAQGWILVNERLPEITNHGERIKQKVLVQTIRGEFFVSYLFREKDDKLFWYKTGEWSWLAGVDKPLAWMPLPEPYKEQ